MKPTTTPPSILPLSTDRTFWLRRRQALLIELAAIEDLLQVKRPQLASHARRLPPKDKR
jgi:hypothetical protein